jgi:hypothetical protein
MPSKYRQKLKKFRERYNKNSPSEKLKSSDRYERNRENVITRAKSRMRNDKTYRMHNAARIQSRLNTDVSYREAMRASTRKRRQHDSVYTERNTAGVKRKLQEDESYRERNRAGVTRRMQEDQSYRERNRDAVKRRFQENTEYRNRNRAALRQRMQNDSSYQQRHAQAVKRQLEKDIAYQTKNRIRASINKRKKLEADGPYRETYRARARVAVQMNVKYRDKNRLRTKERYKKIGRDPSYQEKLRITVQRSRTLIDNEAFGAEASQRNEKHSADNIGMKYTKQGLTQRRQYWMRRSRLLARALENKLILAKQKKMQQSSGVFMMDIKLLFSKAEYAVKKANLKLSKLHSSLETKVSSLLQQHIPINRPVTECDIVTAFGDLRVHTATTEPYYWEQNYSLLSFLKSPVPVNANGEAIVFAPIITKLPPTQTLRYEVHAKTDIIRQWQCNDTICKITQDYIDGTVALLREIVDTPSAKLMDFFLHVDECIELSQRYKAGHYADCCYNLSCTSLFRPARLMSSHFPRLRTIIRRLYEARRLCQCIRSVQMARETAVIVSSRRR